VLILPNITLQIKVKHQIAIPSWEVIIVVHALLPSFRATIFFALQAQSRFKQAAMFSFLFPYQ